MLKCFNKIITGVLAVSCLSVAAVNARLMMSTSSSVELNIPSFKISGKIAENNISIIKKFETKLADIKWENEVVKVVKTAAPKLIKEKVAEVKQPNIELGATVLINFDEPVKLSKINVEYSLPTNLVSLIPDFDFTPSKVMIAEAKTELVEEDTISTTMAAPSEKDDVDPEFFSYETADAKPAIEAQDAVVKKVDAPVTNKTKLTKADYEQMANDFIAFDYPASAPEQSKEVAQVAPTKKEEAKAAALFEVKNNSPKAKPVTTQNDKNKKVASASEMEVMTTQKTKSQSIVMSIQAIASNLVKNKDVKNFEVRFQDDLAEIYEDFGAGEVLLSTHVQGIMNRSMVLLKRGYAPTNTDLIIESNSKVTLPLIEEEVFNALMDKHNKNSSQGALLVDLDEDTDSAYIDAEFSEEILLDHNLKRAKDENFRYKLFLGVNAGNIFLTYKHFDGSTTAKIVHIHEREITFDANLYEEINKQQVSLYEEGLLAKELSPLIIKGDQVRVFASDEVASKLNQNTYKIKKKRGLLGERQYLEVNHLSEPVFAGYRNNTKIVLPSEDFINFVLSKFEDRRLGNRCIIQVNLNTSVANFHVGAESAGSNLMTSTQILDKDGKFYDSVGPKSNKIIIMGENHGPLEQAQDGKVNIKIDYLDGSSQFVTSYCSPNTYLVEQL